MTQKSCGYLEEYRIFMLKYVEEVLGSATYLYMVQPKNETFKMQQNASNCWIWVEGR